MKKSIICGFVLFTGVLAAAQTYQTDTVEWTAGTGSKAATIVIDFDYENYFMFEYRWDDLSVTGDEDATGWDALDAIQLSSDLTVDSGSYTMAVEGQIMELYYVNDLQYPGGQKYDYEDDGSLGWAYMGSTDNESWSQNSPVSLRNLTDNAFDAWVWTNHDMDNMWLPIRQPGQTPVPEPVSVLLLGFGAFFLKKKSK